MNLLTKKGPWVAATLIAAASVFAQNSKKDQKMMFDQGYEVNPGQMMAGYNAPARFDVKGAWDFFFAGSFTYWQASQENMELGIANDVTTGYAINGNVVQMDFGYKPGFKVMGGMNFDHDGWTSQIEYTWYRGTDKAKTTQDATGIAANLLPMQGHPEGIGSPNDVSTPVFTRGNESWRLNLNFLDWEVARWNYVGTKLSFKPFFGARAAWISQKLSATYNTTTAQNTAVSISEKSSSWGLGARAGLWTNWMIGEGFRLYGNGAGDILFTRYTTARLDEPTATGATAGTDRIYISQKNINTLRPHLELEFGFGWGTYFDDNNWHVDMMLGYTFQTFFNQNMFRHYTSAAALNSPILGYSQSPNGDLFIQGMTYNLRFDF